MSKEHNLEKKKKQKFHEQDHNYWIEQPIFEQNDKKHLKIAVEYSDFN